jgi:hypothetical protein
MSCDAVLLEQRCVGDAALLGEVRSVLAAHEPATVVRTRGATLREWFPRCKLKSGRIERFKRVQLLIERRLPFWTIADALRMPKSRSRV